MLTKPELACAIIEGIASVKEDEELQDFVVEVEDKEFKCHRLILSACSGFFRGLLRSGMKESQKRRTKLEGVSMETFAAILETLYTGCDNLTRDNMLNIWLAADQLQIPVVFDNCVNFIQNNIFNETVISVWKVSSQLMHKNIIELCETFLMNNTSLENWNIMYETGNKLGSNLISFHVRDFIKKNYQQILKSEAFLCLRENDLLEIIKSQDLVVSSEDAVVEPIVNWVNNGNQIRSETMAGDLNENASHFCFHEEEEKEEVKEDGKGEVGGREGGESEKGEEKREITAMKPKYFKEYREKCLERFLSATRLCLVNSFSLEKLSHDTLIMNNKITRDMVMDALLYKSIGHQHGHLSEAAIHRKCSGFQNVAVIGLLSGEFIAMSCDEDKGFEINKCPYLANCTSLKLIAYMTDFFAIGDFVPNSSLCFFLQNEWRECMKLTGNGWLGVAVEEFIYLMHSTDQKIRRFNPRFGNFSLENCVNFPTWDKIEHICSFDLFILAFCSEIIKGVDETAVHCLDTSSQTWTRLDSLEGSAKNLVSFRKEKQFYILQTNGNLWEINRDDCKSVNLTLVEALWQGEHELYDAIFFKGSLFIKASTVSKDKIIQIPSTVFPDFVLQYPPCTVSNVVTVIIKKK